MKKALPKAVTAVLAVIAAALVIGGYFALLKPAGAGAPVVPILYNAPDGSVVAPNPDDGAPSQPSAAAPPRSAPGRTATGEPINRG